MYRKSIFSEDLDYKSGKNLSSLSTNLEDTKSSNNIKFQWGGKMTPKRKASSPLQNSKVIGKTSNSSYQLNKIDPQMYADTESRGLVSRIVKYHENNQKTDKTSLRSIYNKPGQFPIVHLNKTEILHTPKKIQSSSCVKIAPPDKLTCQINSRSSILSGSSMRLEPEKTHKDNIIYNSTDVEVVQTKSVLDALKEISRKRINSDDLDEERHKKICPESTDKIDYPYLIGNDLNRNNSTVTKRQRDTQISPNSKTTLIEQYNQKKKLCTKNNDILSSLSSSVRLNPNIKRSSQDDKNTQLETVVNLQYKTYKTQIPTVNEIKQKRSDLNIESTNSFNNNNNNSNINIEEPSTPLNIPTTRIQQEKIQSSQQQPKLTLFNRNYSIESELEGKKRLQKVHNNDGDTENNISFIKPKEQMSTTTNFLNEKDTISGVYKNKLSLMLSCLRGDVDGEDDDEVDSVTDKNKNDKKIVDTNSSNRIITTITTTTVVATTTTSSSSIPPITTLATLLKPNEITVTTQSQNSFKPILFGLSQSTAATTATSTITTGSTIQPTINSNSIKLNEAPKFMVKPTITTNLTPPQNNIQFGVNSTGNTTTTSISTVTTTSPEIINPSLNVSPPRIGGFSFPKSNLIPTATTAISLTTLLSTPPKTTTSTINDPNIPTFTFTIPKKQPVTTSTTAAISLSSESIVKLPFNSGISKDINSVGIGGQQQSSFSFASGTTAIKPIAQTTTTGSGVNAFNFGVGDQQHKSQQPTAIFPFNSGNAASSSSIASGGTNSFMGEQSKTVAATTTTTNSSFSFIGQDLNKTTAVATTTTTLTNSNFSFAQNSGPQQQPQLNNGTFSFGNINSSTNNNANSPTSPINLSTFGAQPVTTTATSSSSLFKFSNDNNNKDNMSFSGIGMTGIKAFNTTAPTTVSSSVIQTTFGNINAITSNTSDFSFGMNTQQQNTTQNFLKPSQNIGGTNSMLGTTTNQQTNATFNFGQPQQQQQQQQQTQNSTSNAFGTNNQINLFDTKSTQNNNNNTNTNKSIFGFGNQQQQQTHGQQIGGNSTNTGMFNSGTSQNQLIKSSIGGAAQQQTTNLFNFGGGDNKTIAPFGGVQQQKQNDQPLISFGTPTTSASSSIETKNTNIFGFGKQNNLNVTGNQGTTGGSATSSFSFNNNNNQNNNTKSSISFSSGMNTNNNDSVFGANNAGANNTIFGFGTTNNNSLPTFGTIASNNNNNQQPPPPSYGSTNNNNLPPPPSYGASINNNNNQSSAFGTVDSEPFSFGGSTTSGPGVNNSNPFGGNTTAVVSPFSGGGMGGVGDKAAFNFGGGSMNQPQLQNNSQQSSGMFGFNGNNNNMNNNNINNSNNIIQSQNGNNPNPFSIGANANSTPRRPIRTATRRLK